MRAFLSAILLSICAAGADYSAAVLVMPFQADSQEQVDLGIGIHNLLENMMLPHGGLEETLVQYSSAALFPAYPDLARYRMGRGLAKDVESLSQRWVVTGRIAAGRLAVTVVDRKSKESLGGSLRFDPPGWVGMRREFAALLVKAGVPWNAEQSRAMFWREDLPGKAMARMGSGLRGYVEVMLYKPEGRGYEREAFEKVFAAGPRSYLAVNNLGYAYFQQGETARAKELFRKALELNSGGIDALDGILQAATLRADVSEYLDALGRKGRARQVQSLPPSMLSGAADRWAAVGDEKDARSDEPYYRGALVLARAAGDRSREGTLLSRLGASFLNRQLFQQSLPLLLEALQILRAVANRSGEAATLNNIGRVYSALGEKQKALSFYEQALPLLHSAGERGSEAATLNNIGLIYDDLGEKQNALGFYEQALLILRTVGDGAGEATTLNAIGVVYFELGEKQKALGYLEQALPILRALGNRGDEAITLNAIGAVYSALGEKQKALGYYEQALPIRHSVGDKEGEATTLDNIGQVYYALEERQKALSYLEQALLILRTVGDRGREATTLNAIGAVHSALGDKQKALGYYEQALSIRRAVGDKEGEALMLNNVGAMHDGLGEKQKALGYYEQARAIQRAVGDRGGEATTLNNIGRLHDQLGERQKALSYYEQALPIWRAVGDRRGEAATLHNLAAMYEDLGEKQKALGYLEQALPILRALGNRGDEAITLNSFGTVYSALGEKQKALGFYEQARALCRAVGDRRGEAVTLGNIALLWRTNNPSLAAWYAKQAINVSQRLRQGVGGLGVEQRQALDQQLAPTFLFTVEILLRQGRLTEAQEVISVLKASESFTYGRAESLDYLKSSLALTARERGAAEGLEAIGEELELLGQERSPLALLKNRGGEENRKLGDLDRQVDAASVRFRAKLAEIEASFRATPMGVEATLRVPGAERIGATLRCLDAGTVALYAVAFEKDYAILLAAGDALQVFWSPVGKTALSGKVKQFREALQRPDRDPRPLAEELHNLLLPEGLRTVLAERGARHLMWSLDGALRYLPIAALHDGKRYLGQTYRHSLFSPASDGKLEAAAAAQWSGMAFGASKGGDLPALPAVKEECEKIFGQRAGQPVKGACLLDGKFTRAALLGHDCRCNVIHLATHFTSKPGTAANSKLLLGDGTTISMAELEETTGLLKGIDLVTLSACETAIGQAGDGRELDSLANVMQRLGANAVLASLWSVNDQSTALFMKEFYRVRQSTPGMTKAEALQRTQRAMLDGQINGNGCGPPRKGASADAETGSPGFACEAARPYAHPYYWAPFVLMGNWK